MSSDILVQVPPELWCEIWILLPMEDIVAVSQTCRRWRNMALSSPMLWCELDYVSSLHPWACGCGKCGVDEFSNLPLLHDVLPRSGALPIALTITALRDTTKEEDLDELSEFLRPELHRLHALRIRSLDPDSAPAFLANFDALPALRRLFVGSDIDFRVQNSIFAHGWELDMPALVTLEVRGEFLFPNSPPTSLSLPALSRLTMGLASLSELSEYIDMCPCLEYLQLRLPTRGLAFESADTRECTRTAILRMPRCSTIDIIGMDLDQVYQEHVILDIFDNPPSRPSLALSYNSSVEAYDATGLHILAAIQRPTAVSLALATRSDGDYFVTSLKDGTRERSVAFRLLPGDATPDISFIWAHMSLCDIQKVQLAIDARLWNPPALDSRLLRAASRLTLSFHAPEDVDLAVQPYPACLMPSLSELKICVAQRATAQPSSLERLRESWIARRRLALVDETSMASSRIRFPAGYLRRLVRSFNLPQARQLASIAVDRHVDFEDDAEGEAAELTRGFMRCDSSAQAQT